MDASVSSSSSKHSSSYSLVSFFIETDPFVEDAKNRMQPLFDVVVNFLKL